MRRTTLVLLTALSAVFAWSIRGGGDHGNTDWTPGPGDTISGQHFNIRTFRIPQGQTNYIFPYLGGGAVDTAGQLQILADTILILGTLDGSGRGYGGGGGGQNDIQSTPGGRGGVGGKGGQGAQGTRSGSPFGGGGGGGSLYGAGGAAGSQGQAGANGDTLAGGNGGGTSGNNGGFGGPGVGGGGGGGAGVSGPGVGGGGGGGGGTGGIDANWTAGGNGGGTWRGLGGAASTGNSANSGQNGGYLGWYANGDTTHDSTVVRGSGGGGGGTSSNGSYGGGGGGGGAGGAAISLFAVDSLQLGQYGAIYSQGGGGGMGAWPSNYNVYGGGGAGGGVALAGKNVVLSGEIDVRGRQMQSLTTQNGGTIKIFYGYLNNAAALNDGRLFTSQAAIHDVGVTRLFMSADTLDSAVTITPACSVYNYGTRTENYYVNLKIGTLFVCSTNVTAHPASARRYVTFAPWTASERGPLLATCSTHLAGDVTTANDRQTRNVFVRVRDVMTLVILAPTGTVNYHAVVTPSATLRNLGDVKATVAACFSIDDGYTDTIVRTIAAGADSTFDFSPDWTANVIGTHLVRCTTRLAGGVDVNPGNDRADTTVTVSAHDVGVSAIVAPLPSMPPGAFSPVVRLRNFGSTREQNVSVTFRIDGPPAYQQTQSLANGLPVGLDTLISFNSWSGAIGTYVARCSVYLGGDQVQVNDTSGLTFQIGNIDVGPTSILEPTGQVDTGAVITPWAMFRNFSARSATFQALFRITNASRVVAYCDTEWLTIPGSAQSSLTFRTWPKPHAIGSFATTCSTIAAADTYSINNAYGGTFEITAPPGAVGWSQRASMPAGPMVKNVKDGGCLTYHEEGGTGFVYALKGNNRTEFYRFNTADNSWATLDSVPVVGRSGRKKTVKKGATMATADDVIYAAKGNNSYEFWSYRPGSAGFPWQQMTDVPGGAKAVREGSGAAAVTLGDTTYVYLLKGSGTLEFYRFNTALNSWQQLADVPGGTSGMTYKNGSCITYDSDRGLIYALKANSNEFAAYDPVAGTWTSRAALPLVSTRTKKKVRAGSSIAYDSRVVYALKGGNTTEFWQYQVDSDRWVAGNNVPIGGGKRVNAGGALAFAPRDRACYALKGNNTLELFRYGVASLLGSPLPGRSPENILARTEPGVSSAELQVSPNPFSTATTIRYSLPKAGIASIRLYDVTGKLVTTLAGGYHQAGTSSFVLHPSSLSRGVYILKLEAAGSVTTQKLIVE